MSDHPDGHIELKATRENYERFMAFIESRLHHARLSAFDRTKILTACEEVTVNVINYAYTTRQGTLSIALRATPEAITITFIDGGRAFNLVFDLKALEYLSSAGLGVFLVACKRAAAVGTRVEVTGATGVVKEVLDITRFSTLMGKP